METAEEARRSKGFLLVKELKEAIGKQNNIFDFNSVLVSEETVIGSNNIFYPNIVIEQQGTGKITIGSNNIFYPGVYIFGSGGEITIGDNNLFGPSGLTIKANFPDAKIIIGSNGRYCDGAKIMGKTNLDDGSQILGDITVQNCSLAGGGGFQQPDPDERGAVLKGFGLARDISLEVGQVINGAGDFNKAPRQYQREYHPKEKKV